MRWHFHRGYKKNMKDKNWILRNMERERNRSIIICAYSRSILSAPTHTVSVRPDGENTQNRFSRWRIFGEKKKTRGGWVENGRNSAPLNNKIPFFYCRGVNDEKKLTFPTRKIPRLPFRCWCVGAFFRLPALMIKNVSDRTQCYGQKVCTSLTTGKSFVFHSQQRFMQQ